MRTTVTLDADTLVVVRRLMTERQVSFKVALNDAIRAGTVTTAAPVELPVYDMGAPSIDLTRALALAGHLEDEALLEKLRRGA